MNNYKMINHVTPAISLSLESLEHRPTAWVFLLGPLSSAYLPFLEKSKSIPVDMQYAHGFR